MKYKKTVREWLFWFSVLLPWGGVKSIFSLRPGILDREEDEDQRDEPPRPRKERGARIEGEGVMTAGERRWERRGD